MSEVHKPVATVRPARRAERTGVGARLHSSLGRIPTGVLWLVVILWTIPTFGLLVNSFREPLDQRRTGWWTVFEDPTFTLDAYDRALTEAGGGSLSMWDYFLNSLSIAIPATIIPIGIAALAAYAFAWMNFPGRNWLFIMCVAMLAIPLQAALVPLLNLFGDMGILGDYLSLWLAHTAFGLPLAIFLLHNYISSLPRDLFEAIRIDGADHMRIFRTLVLPLSMPALAAFAIFQFLWVWNDYLVALVFVQGSNAANSPMTVNIVNMVTSKGRNLELLPAAAFISMIVPLVIFFALQRYFVRGLLAGSVKG
jgi:alpha-glucoside transport system permease protein